ncbi:MAG: methyltransferase domain-containing protein [Solirubrobacteraceae bacterium]
MSCEADTQRAELREGWERSAAGWSAGADRIRDSGMPVSNWMIEHLGLVPGQRLLELAAGPGDTGFLAAELIKAAAPTPTSTLPPTPASDAEDRGGGPRESGTAGDGTLVCSDGADAMLEVARQRAAKLGIENVEFKRLELEWIDLPTASVDAILCRWGFMLTVDPGTALGEARRVLRPGGRLALAVWDRSVHNLWATIPGQALVNLGLGEPRDPTGPGMFALAAPGRLEELLQSAGFVESLVETVEVGRRHPNLDDYLEETLDLSRLFSEAFKGLSESQRAQVRSEIALLAAPYTEPDGSLRLPGRSLVALAEA